MVCTIFFFPLFSLFSISFCLLPLRSSSSSSRIRRDKEEPRGCGRVSDNGRSDVMVFRSIAQSLPLISNDAVATSSSVCQLVSRSTGWRRHGGTGRSSKPISFSFFTLSFSLSPSIRRHIETLSRRHFEIERSRDSQKFKMDGNWLPGVKRTWQYRDCTTIIRVEQVSILIIISIQL